MAIGEIKVNYPVFDKMAQEFEAYSERVQQLNRRLEDQEDVLRAGAWIGEEATRFYIEMDNELLPALSRLENAMNAYSDTMRRIKQVYEEAEYEASARVMSGSLS